MPPPSTPFSKPPLRIFLPLRSLHVARSAEEDPPSRDHLDSHVRRRPSRRPALAARGCRAASGAGDPGIHPLSPPRRHAGGRRADPSLCRGPWLCVPAPRHPRQRRFRGGDPRRIFQAGAGRRRRGHRLARGADMVRRQGRDDWNLLGRIQRAAGRRAPAAGPQGHRHRLLDRRPLCRRHAFHGRQPYDRQYGMGLGLLLHHGPRARSADRRRQMARDVAPAAGGGDALLRQLAAPSAARRLLEAWLGLRGHRRHHLRRHGGGRLGRRLYQRRVPAAAHIEGPEARHRRALGP